jgi:hypothetical protein
MDGRRAEICWLLTMKDECGCDGGDEVGTTWRPRQRSARESDSRLSGSCVGQTLFLREKRHDETDTRDRRDKREESVSRHRLTGSAAQEERTAKRDWGTLG